MITTREINVDLSKGGRLNRVTTKNVDASPLRVFDFPKIIFVDGIAQEMSEDFAIEIPKHKLIKSISTHNIADVADITEKKRRDDIAIEKKASKSTIQAIKTEPFPLNFITDDEGFKKLNTQFVFVEFDGLIQAFSRKELK